MSTKRIEIIPEIESWDKQLICGSCSILILKLPEMSSNIVIKDRPSHLILIFCGKMSFLLSLIGRTNEGQNQERT